MIKVEKIAFNGWKNCIKITNGKVELIVTTDVGPRIISLTLNGSKNHMAVFPEQAGKSGEEQFVAYGGHRIWHAPEVKGRTDLPDNTPTEYTLMENGVCVFSKADKSGIIKGMEITLSESGEITVNHVLKNTTLFDIELSIWGLSQLDPSGIMCIPNSTLDTGLIGNRAVSLWPYSKMNDKRITWGDKFLCLKPDIKATSAFKIGVTCDEQYAAYFNHNQMFIKRFEYYYGSEYPNYYCNFETYTNDKFIEFETLSPLFTLEAGEISSHTEKWYLCDNVQFPGNNEEKIEKAIKDSKILDT